MDKGWFWLFAQQISDWQWSPSQGGSALLRWFWKNNLHTSAAPSGSIFFPKALPVIPAQQVRVLNKKPEMAPAER